MYNVNLCIPVLNRYDKLRELIRSLESSTVTPVVIHVIDNGRSARRLEIALRDAKSPVDIFVPNVAMGVAEAWNWFIANVSEERLIVNDDVTFAPKSIEEIVSIPGDMVTGTPGRAFSCFLLRDSCVTKVGYFDEGISPGYAFFEDCDYEERMRQKGTMFAQIDCGVQHVESSTLEVVKRSPLQLQDHHRKFVIAQENFRAKWGHLPVGIERR